MIFTDCETREFSPNLCEVDVISTEIHNPGLGNGWHLTTNRPLLYKIGVCYVLPQSPISIKTATSVFEFRIYTCIVAQIIFIVKLDFTISITSTCIILNAKYFCTDVYVLMTMISVNVQCKCNISDCFVVFCCCFCFFHWNNLLIFHIIFMWCWMCTTTLWLTVVFCGVFTDLNENCSGIYTDIGVNYLCRYWFNMFLLF